MFIISAIVAIPPINNNYYEDRIFHTHISTLFWCWKETSVICNYASDVKCDEQSGGGRRNTGPLNETQILDTKLVHL